MLVTQHNQLNIEAGLISKVKEQDSVACISKETAVEVKVISLKYDIQQLRYMDSRQSFTVT